jgi:hypothetical protein
MCVDRASPQSPCGGCGRIVLSPGSSQPRVLVFAWSLLGCIIAVAFSLPMARDLRGKKRYTVLSRGQDGGCRLARPARVCHGWNVWARSCVCACQLSGWCCDAGCLALAFVTRRDAEDILPFTQRQPSRKRYRCLVHYFRQTY